jgi:group I intron endonuclease
MKNKTNLSTLIPISGVYSIVNQITGRAYIGQSINIVKRWATHVEDLTAGTHTNKELQKDWNLYGAKCFTAQIIKVCEPQFLLRDESFFIREHRGLGGVYNIGSKKFTTGIGVAPGDT